MNFLTNLFTSSVSSTPSFGNIPQWLIPDNWEDSRIPGKFALSDDIDLSPNIIKGVFSTSDFAIIEWVVTTLINTGHPWKVVTEAIPDVSDKLLFLVHVPNKNEKPAFYQALKFYLEQIYVSQN